MQLGQCARQHSIRTAGRSVGVHHHGCVHADRSGHGALVGTEGVPVSCDAASDRAAAALEAAVAVEQLGPEDTQRIFEHFMALSSDDRARRFSYHHANSEWTMRYARQIDFARQSLLALTTSSGSVVALLQIC